jgi:hypothetical protein
MTPLGKGNVMWILLRAATAALALAVMATVVAATAVAESPDHKRGGSLKVPTIQFGPEWDPAG